MKLNTKDQGKSGIYLIRNLINGKVYIGKAKDIYKRNKAHVTNLNRKIRKQENDHFINAWAKYGKINFAYTVLEYLPLNEELINKKEIEYIDLYKSLNPKFGYNKRYDSSTGLIVSEETRKKLSIAQIKRFQDPIERLKCSSTYWKNNPIEAQKMGEKVAEKTRKYKIGKFDYYSEEIIEIFNSRKELSLKNSDYYIQAILGCCNGDKKSYKGYKWKYISIETGQIINKSKTMI